MWGLSFKAYPGKETLGTITATYDNGIVKLNYEGSVNLDDKGSVDDFMTRAKKTLAGMSALDTTQTKIDDKLSVITADLNK